MRRMGGVVLVVVGLLIHALLLPAYALVFVHGLSGVSVRLLVLVSTWGMAAFLSMVAGWGLLRGKPWAALGLRLLGVVIVLGGLVTSFYMETGLGLAVLLAGVVILLVPRRWG